MSHPINRAERIAVNKKNKRYYSKKTVKNSQQVITQTVKEIPVKLPDMEACQLCGDPMELLSIELGYSCSNEDCLLHFHGARELLYTEEV